MTDVQARAGAQVLLVAYGWKESGGGTRLPRSIARALAERGYGVSVFYASLREDFSCPPYSLEEQYEDGVRLFGLFNRPALFIDPDNPEREIRDPHVCERFNKVLDLVRPELVHFHNFHGLTLSLAEEVHRRGIPSCFSPHNYYMIDPELYLLKNGLELWGNVDLINSSEAVARNPHLLGWYQRRIATTHRLMNEWVDLILASSRRQMELLVEYGADPSRFALIHQASRSSDELWNSPAFSEHPYRPSGAPLRAGIIGGLMPIKGVHIVVAAVQEFEPGELELHIYGDPVPGYREVLESLDRKGFARFHGDYTTEELPSIASRLDVAVMSSVVEDCAPLAVLELHAMRLPVIGARIGGIPDFITEEVDGVLYDPYDMKGLARILRSFLEDPERLREMRSNITAPSRTFAGYLDHLETVYATLLSGHPLVPASLSWTMERRRPLARHNGIRIAWHGGLFVHHSLSLVNRELCLRLLEQGAPLSFHSTEPDEFIPNDPRYLPLVECRGRQLQPVDVTVRHHWPPDFTPVAGGKLVVIQPWEYGSVPAAWVGPINDHVDELWVPSSFVRESYLAGGVRPEKVRVVPNGVDTVCFSPQAPPRLLPTRKGYRFLFVGGTIHRKGIDLLLAAYADAFNSQDDVCLVIKDMGGNGIYQGQTAGEMIKAFRSRPEHPELLYLEDMLDEREMASLYTACHCLVHPYRGEGFGLPIAEAMACGLPVIVTGDGAALDFCSTASAWLVPARREPLSAKTVGNLETVGVPWLAEPDLDSLRQCLVAAFRQREEGVRRGAAGRKTILEGYTWERVGLLAAESLKSLVAGAPEGAVEQKDQPETSSQSVPESAPGVLNRSTARAIAEAWRLAMAGESGRAVDTLLRKGIRLSPGEYASYGALLELLAALKRFEDGLGVVQELPEGTERSLALAWEAVCRAGLGEDGPALRAAEAALKLNPGSGRAWNVLGILACRQGDLAAGEEHFRKAALLDPSLHEPYANLGVLAWGNGNREEAVRMLAESVRRFPLDSQIVAMLKTAATAAGLRPLAEEALAAALESFPASRAASEALVEMLVDDDRPAEALRHLGCSLALFGPEEPLLAKALELRQGVGERMVTTRGRGVSLCMIIKNEETCLSRCLQSVAPLVHEMVIVDTGSSDRSRDIARAFGARTFSFQWTGNFSDARNFALQQAEGAWILCMDADETFSRRDHDIFRQMVASSNPERDAWSVPIRNYSHRANIQGWTANDGAYPDEEREDGWYPAQRVRLFPNDRRIRFSGEVHELVEPALRKHGFIIRDAPMAAHHYGEVEGTPENLQAKQQRYFDLGKRKLAENPRDLVALTELGVQAGELGLYDEALELWDRALALHPTLVEAHFNRGFALMGLKRYGEALAASLRALEIEPGHREAAFNYATCELYAGDPARAVRRIEPLVDQGGPHPQLLAVTVLLALATGRLDLASRCHAVLRDLQYGFDFYLEERLERLRSLGRTDLETTIRAAAQKIFAGGNTAG